MTSALKWGSPAVTRLKRQADASMSYNAGVVTETIQHVGFLRAVDLRYNATYGYTKSSGGSTQDAQGPFNAVQMIDLTVNGSQPIIHCPAWMLYLYDLIHYAKTNAGWSPSAPSLSGTLQAATATDVFSFPSVPGSSGNITQLWTLRWPFVVELAGVREIGMFLLQNDETNLQITPTFNANAASATALAAPYDIAGGDSFTLGTPTMDVLREFYAIPADKTSYPDIGYFHTLQYQRVSLTSTQIDVPIIKGGIVLRIIYQLVDGSTPSLMADSTISSLQLLYGSNETPYDEKVKDVLLRQQRSYGRSLPQGVLVHDFWGDGGQTFRNTFDTLDYQNLRGRLNFASTPNAGSYADVIVEKLVPIAGYAEPLYSGQNLPGKN